jgi:hypothetical protein
LHQARVPDKIHPRLLPAGLTKPAEAKKIGCKRSRRFSYNSVKFSKNRTKLVLDVNAIGKFVKTEIQLNWLINRPNFIKNRPEKKYDGGPCGPIFVYLIQFKI